MEKPRIPADEKERLATLRALKILDTAPEARFDRLTLLAQRLFDVPVALLSLVDENRQWFKSRQGVDASETPRDISFCGHAVLGKDLFVVNDALEDPRFRDNPLVLEDPKIRFYAGYPVAARNGKRMGSFCVIDRKPRKLSAPESRLLYELGKVVELELARTSSDLEDQLTGTANRKGFVTLLNFVLKFSSEMKLPIAVLLVFLKNLAQVNKDQEPGAGDRVLVEVARLLGQAVRRADVVGRNGADEFYVFLPKCSEADLGLVTKRIDDRLEELNAHKTPPHRIQLVHAGLAWSSDSSGSVEDLLSRAENLMRDLKLRANR